MAGICIFCGKEGNLSKEHLWPSWLGKMYLRKGDEKHTRGAQTLLNKKLLNDGTYERPGHLFTLKNRVVCQDCNSGWMSEVENETKPLLLNMIGGKEIEITYVDIQKLAFWIALKIVTAEFANKDENIYVTPHIERRVMMDERKIPPFFNIFVGTHSTGHNSAWLRHSWTMSYSPNGPIPPLEGRQRNAQAISFIIGPIFIYAMHIRLLDFFPEKHFKFGTMIKIWPSKNGYVKWPPRKALKKYETDVLAFMAQDFNESNAVKHILEMPE